MSDFCIESTIYRLGLKDRDTLYIPLSVFIRISNGNELRSSQAYNYNSEITWCSSNRYIYLKPNPLSEVELYKVLNNE